MSCMLSQINTSGECGVGVMLLLFCFFLPLSIAAVELAGVGVLVCGFVLLRRYAGRFPVAGWWILAPALLFAGYAMIVSLYGPRRMISISKFHRFLWLLLIPVVAVWGHENRRVRVQYLMDAFLLGALALALYDLVRVVAVLKSGEPLYMSGNMRDPQLYMTALLFLLGALLCRHSSFPRWWKWITPVLFITLILHFKRGVWISFGTCAILMIIFLRRWKILIGVFLLVGLLVFVPPVQQRICMTTEEFALNQGGRWALWTEVAPALLEAHPLGVGWKAMQHEDLVRHTDYVQPHLDHLHNNILQMCIETGWAGALLWMFWMGATLGVMVWAAKRVPKTSAAYGFLVGAVFAFLGLLSNGMVENNFGDSEIMILFCLLMGMAGALINQEDHPFESPTPYSDLM